ncbi:hypothetical protein EIP86_003056 [Pleurotus ostreatoroseus]|nr:hypothetical protein EIP86_003056 [Pleurotus ostreatoroseus]
MSPTGFAILGSGIFAKEAHLPAVAALESGVAELKAVYSRSEKSAADLAGFAKELLKLSAVPSVYHDADPNANLDVLLARTDIAAVVIALPITLQPTIVRKALAAGKHVLSEKPVAPDVAGGIALINDYNTKYKSKSLIWRVAENYEVEPAYQAAAKVIKDGRIGKVAFFNARVVNYIEKSNKYYNTPWRTIPDYQGGFLLDGGVHTIAALRTILSTTLTSLSGYASLNQDYLPPHDTINAVVRTASGAHGLVELTFGSPTPSRNALAHAGISVTGTEGWLALENAVGPDGKKGAMQLSVYTRVKNEKGEVVGEEKEETALPLSGVKEEFSRFFAAVRGQDDGFGKPEDALKDVAFIQAALNSNGEPVDLVKLVQ